MDANVMMHVGNVIIVNIIFVAKIEEKLFQFMLHWRSFIGIPISEIATVHLRLTHLIGNVDCH